MPKTRFQFILGFLFLLNAVHGHNCPQVTTPGCNAQAWVRAPDLTPNAIVHGDARVKISAECPDVDNVLLGLRFKERSFVKALRSREDVELLNPNGSEFDFSDSVFDSSDPSPWAMIPSRNRIVQEEILRNKDLWIVREEERVVFETTQHINTYSAGSRGFLRDIVQDFSILVPSTNFPPALDIFHAPFSFAATDEIVDVEWIYEYFVQVSFTNGTTKEIFAGFTAFQPLHDPTHPSDGLISATVGLEPFDYVATGKPVEKSPIANYSVEISTDSSFTLFAGTKNQIVTGVVTRTGSARTFSDSEPLSVSVCVTPDRSPEWSAEYGISDTHAKLHDVPSVLRAAPEDGDIQSWTWWSWHSCQYHYKTAVIMPNSTSDEIQANETVTTASAPFTISIDVNEDHPTTFETYYQTLANSLVITLDIVDPDEPSDGPGCSCVTSFEDDEEAWVPWEKPTWELESHSRIWKTHSGRLPIVVHPSAGEGTPSRHCPQPGSDTSGQVILSDEEGCRQPSLVHYLAEGARSPIFVDRRALPELLAEDPVERELRAPILEPVVSSPPKGEEVIRRYSLPRNKPLIYVGETWAKKVAPQERNFFRNVRS